MGSCFSCKKPTQFNGVRVVHIDGYWEDYEGPITVSQVIGNSPCLHFLCTPARLLQAGPSPMKPDVRLERGRVYFLLPYSALQFEASLVDLASMSKKLTAIARAGCCRAKLARTCNSPGPCGSSPAQIGPKGCPKNRSSPWAGVGSENCVSVSIGAAKPSKSLPWKPILATIRERSFNRRSESDLLEKQLETCK